MQKEFVCNFDGLVGKFTITQTAAATKGDKNNELKRPAN